MSECQGFTLQKPVCVLTRCAARLQLRDVNIYVNIATVESVRFIGQYRKNLYDQETYVIGTWRHFFKPKYKIT